MLYLYCRKFSNSVPSDVPGLVLCTVQCTLRTPRPEPEFLNILKVWLG
jgi:hypothetical protein